MKAGPLNANTVLHLICGNLCYHRENFFFIQYEYFFYWLYAKQTKGHGCLKAILSIVITQLNLYLDVYKS